MDNSNGDMGEQQKAEERTLSLTTPARRLEAKTTPARRLEAKKPVEMGHVRQSFSHGRSKTVTVEVKKKRGATTRGMEPEATPGVARRPTAEPAEPSVSAPEISEAEEKPTRGRILLRTLTDDEKQARARALEGARIADSEARRQAEADAVRRAADEGRLEVEHAAAEKRVAEEEARKRTEEDARQKAEEQAAKRLAGGEAEEGEKEEDRTSRLRRPTRVEPRRPPLARRGKQPRRRSGKLTVTQALDDHERVRSLASVRRARERERRAASGAAGEAAGKVVRDVIVPETITVQELANRMAERGVDVVRALMTMGVMATINQSIDADTAELLVGEFGHRLRRVSDSDVEIGLKGEADEESTLEHRPPVVTVMGHVDHGKTSLLDAIRETDVVKGERGGITQHIGAYQIQAASGGKITFIDTPGHEAFTAMRARGAHVTDLVVLVVAADDGVMPQTVEAINHAKAANVPIIVAVNKMDRPDADPDRVRRELLQHEIVLEELGGEVLSVEVSAKEKTNLDKLEEIILLQAEVLDLRANPERSAEGIVIEARLDRGRGVVASVLVQRGSLRIGDILVAGDQWGRVRAVNDDRGRRVESAGPSSPVEVLGLNHVPDAGDEFVVADSDTRARQVAEFRQGRTRDARASTTGPGTLEQMFSEIESGGVGELPVVIKTDVHGSLEAILGAVGNLGGDEVAVRVLHAGVGGINESDIVLAAASKALVIGFNVRADAQAREIARRDKIDLRYYSVIYELIDDFKQILTGMLKPLLREQFLGNAEILEVFKVSKAGKIAGCRVTEGVMRQGARVRLLRDSVVVHEGQLGTLKRFKDDVREVRDGTECGMSFENYQDIQVGDTVEAFEVEETARTL